MNNHDTLEGLHRVESGYSEFSHTLGIVSVLISHEANPNGLKWTKWIGRWMVGPSQRRGQQA